MDETALAAAYWLALTFCFSVAMLLAAAALSAVWERWSARRMKGRRWR